MASLNLCTDSLLFELLDDARIASVTALSRDPNLSFFHARAATLPVNHGAIEEILSPPPDLVITSDNTTAFASHLLTRVGIEVMHLAAANTIDAYRANLHQLAVRLGTESRAASILAKLDAALVEQPSVNVPRWRALVYQPNGFVPGGASLIHDLIIHAGLQDFGGERTLGLGTYLSLEELVLAAPDLLVFSARSIAAPSLAEAQLDHPVMRQLMQANGRPLRRRSVPENLWTCAGAHNGAAVRRLRAAR